MISLLAFQRLISTLLFKFNIIIILRPHFSAFQMYSQLFQDTLSNENQLLSAFLQEKKLEVLSILDQKNLTFIHKAVIAENLPALKLIFKHVNKLISEKLLQEKDKYNWINQLDSKGYAAIHHAISDNNFQITNQLYNQGANIRVRSRKGLNALHMAAQFNSIRLIYYLLQKGCQIGEEDDEGNNALHWACYRGNQTAALVLISFGIDVNAKNKTTQWTALHMSVHSGSPQLVRKLISKGARKDIADNQNRKPIDIAKQNNFIVTTGYLQQERFSLKGILGCNPKNIKGRRSWHNIILFLYILFSNFVLIGQIFILKQFIEHNQILVVLYFLMLTISIFSFCSVSGSNPGYISQRKYQQFKSLIQLGKQKKLCFECRTFKPERSRHCEICEKCVAVYDHHCEWLSVCIGCNNFLSFIIFLIIMSVSFSLQINLYLRIILVRLEEQSKWEIQVFLVFLGTFLVILGLLFTSIQLIVTLYRACENKTTFQANRKQSEQQQLRQSVQYDLSQNLLQDPETERRRLDKNSVQRFQQANRNKTGCYNLYAMLIQNSNNNKYFNA